MFSQVTAHRQRLRRRPYRKGRTRKTHID
jgi:hypothetical protein